MEVTGFSRWFERLLAELGFELWIGDSAEVEAMRVKKRKTVREDARLLLRLMREDRFPRVWVPSPENRHIHASVLHDIGVPAKIAQQQLGHASVETTQNFYTHAIPETHRRAIESLEEALFPVVPKSGIPGKRRKL